jgi:hypothetical protein
MSDKRLIELLEEQNELLRQQVELAEQTIVTTAPMTKNLLADMLSADLGGKAGLGFEVPSRIGGVRRVKLTRWQRIRSTVSGWWYAWR